MMKRIVFAATPFLVLAWILGAAVPATAQSVLKIARGLQSNNVSVFTDRAVVIESSVPFVEVSVANPSIADVQPISNRSIYIFGRTRGVTSLTLLGENGRLITNVVIRVQADHSEMKQRLKELLPNEPIEVRTAGGGLILSGTVSGKDKIDRALSLARAYAGDGVTNMMTVGGTQQVMLKVKVAEINRSAAKDLGVSYGVFGQIGEVGASTVVGSSVRITDNDQTDGLSLSTGFTNNVPGAGAFAGAFGAIIGIADNLFLNIQLDALEQRGFARTLSEPNLVALSGTQASFLVGGEVAIPVVGDDGDITVTFKPIGVNIEFSPIVLDGELINITVSAEVSEIGPTTSIAGVETFTTNSRRAETVVELKDGQAFAIAGLIEDSFQDTISQVPWLGDLPILGALFRSTNFQRGQTEVVIFISAHLVTPVGSEEDISLPTDRVAIPNETELFLMGSTAGPVGPGGAGIGVNGAGFDGDYGYVLE